ncbi:MAG: hypothetical protein ACTHK0_05105 [Ginsengibacter sp.]
MADVHSKEIKLLQPIKGRNATPENNHPSFNVYLPAFAERRQGKTREAIGFS